MRILFIGDVVGKSGRTAVTEHLPSLVKDWKLAEFIATMRTGIDPNGRELSRQMPWRPIGRMDDEELAAVYEYLTHLPDS